MDLEFRKDFVEFVFIEKVYCNVPYLHHSSNESKQEDVGEE